MNPPDLPPRRIPRIGRLAALADDLDANFADAPYALPPGAPPLAEYGQLADYYGLRGDDVFALFRSNSPRSGAVEAAIVRDWIARNDPRIAGNVPGIPEFSSGLPGPSAAFIGGAWRAAFDRTWITDLAGGFWAADGRGATRDGAIRDYYRVITGRWLAVAGPGFGGLQAPKNTIADDGSKSLVEVPLWVEVLPEDEARLIGEV